MKEINLDNAAKSSLSSVTELYKKSLNKSIDEFISTVDFSSKDYYEQGSIIKYLKKEDLIVKYKEQIRVNYTNAKLLAFLVNTTSRELALSKIELDTFKKTYKSTIKRLSKLIFILSILLIISILTIIGIVIGFSI